MPVIASSIGDHQRLLSENNGWVFQHDEPDELADLLFRFAALSGRERATMGSASRLFAESHLSKQALVEHYDNLLVALCENRPMAELSAASAD